MNYSSLVSLMILVSAALFFLPSALSGMYCYSCGSSHTPEHCNATQTRSFCSPGQGQRAYCIALTAELTNGTKIGIRGCRAYSAMAGCKSSIACTSENETMSQGARFKRCIAECCNNSYCNQNLYPMLPTPSPSPSSSYTSVMASIPMPTGMTTDKKPETTPGPSAKAAALVRSYEWLFVSVLSLFLYIM